MAHKGLSYPVLFRRDWNLNVTTNREGYADHYCLFWRQLPRGVGQVLQFTHWDCGPAFDGAPGEQWWDSKPQHVGPTNWYCRLRSKISGDHAGYDLFIDIYEFGGPLALGLYVDLGPYRQPGWPVGNGTYAYAANPIWFDIGPGSFPASCAVNEKRWFDVCV